MFLQMIPINLLKQLTRITDFVIQFIKNVMNLGKKNILCPEQFKFRQQFIQFVEEIFINLFLIVHEKSQNIPNDKEEDFDDNINFYALNLLLDENIVYEILKIGLRERRHFNNNIF